MSFDLRILNNDLAINPDGTIQTVENNEKLIQDVLKAILTPLGSNIFFKWYGNNITNRVVGQNLPPQLLDLEIKRGIEDSIFNIMSMQKSQARSQYVSAAETISSINEISVLRNEEDPRQFEIYIAILTKKLNVIETTFSVRV